MAFVYPLIALILGGIYYRTLLPVVGYWGDMAKFNFLGQVLGTPHLTGYPEYLMLNALFVRIFPWGSLAVRTNLLSAGFSILAVCFFYASLRLFNVRLLAALAAALAFGLGYSLWSFSLVAEVYSFNILFCAALLYFLLRWRRFQHDSDFWAACLVYALSFGNHLTMIALLPAFAWLVWKTDRTIFWNPRKIIGVIICILVGISPYAYVVLRAADPTTAFVEITGGYLVRFLLHPSADSLFAYSLSELMTDRLLAWLGFVWREFHLALLLVLWGLVLGLRTIRRNQPGAAPLLPDRATHLFLLLFAVGNTAFGLQFDLREIRVYFLPTYMILAFYLGLALEELIERVVRWLPDTLNRRVNARVGIACLAVPILLFGLNYPQVDQSQHVLHARIVEKILTTVDQNAVIVVDEYDYACYFWYYLLGEGYQHRGLYALPLYYPGASGVAAYLRTGQPMAIPPLRKQVPNGLPVYALWTIAPDLKAAGLQVQETTIKYIFRVTADP